MVQFERIPAAQRSTDLMVTDEARAWACLLALAQRASQGRPLVGSAVLDVDAAGHVHSLHELSAGDAAAGFIKLSPSLPQGFIATRPIDPAAKLLLSMFVPLVVGKDSAQLVVAHLGQSEDGYAATFCGRNKFITGEEDIRHTHRMRALFDAVLVGASTVEIDDCLLTTRLVSGSSPVRVVVDPRARLRADHQVFADTSARTLLVSAPGVRARLPSHVELMSVPCTAAGLLDLEQLVRALRTRGLSRIFIEGGALTIAHFLRAKLLHRLQLAVAPVTLGPGPALPAHRLSPRALPQLGQTRHFPLGRDTLFETALRDRAAQPSAAVSGA